MSCPSLRQCDFSLRSFAALHLKLLLLTGYLIGYLVHRKKDLAPTCEASVETYIEPFDQETGPAPLMDWDDVKTLLAQKLSAAKFEPVLR